jgi:SAM-dependent methyltransferase
MLWAARVHDGGDDKMRNAADDERIVGKGNVATSPHMRETGVSRDLDKRGVGALVCPSCGGSLLTAFHTVNRTPVTCAAVFDTAEEARAVPAGRVELFHCGGCELIFNPHFDKALAEVGARYEGSQGASAHFSEFARTLARGWVDRYGLAGRSVLEIGCGRGEFLRLLVHEGVGRAIGLDPVATPSKDAHAGLELLSRRFDASTLDFDADAVVCRHTLEHTNDVGDFLHLLAEWARRGRDRVVLFEVPATERVLAECAFWDVYYEHCSYFTARSLELAFARAGFRVRRVERVYGEQYLILEAVARAGAQDVLDDVSEPPMNRLLDECLRFGREARRAIRRCDQGLEALASHGAPVVLWQGASKTVGFLSSLHRADVIHSAVDLSVQRHGKFLPGSGLPVHAPEALKVIQPRFVVLMNAIYVDEVQAALKVLGSRATLLTVNDLCAGRWSADVAAQPESLG